MNNAIKWTEIDPNDLPEGQVLVFCEGSLLVRQLSLHRGQVICEGEGTVVYEDPTHYIAEEFLLCLNGLS